MPREECSWCNDPAHVRPGRSRREFLYVGLVGGLGLTLGNYLGFSEARGETKTYDSVTKVPMEYQEKVKKLAQMGAGVFRR